LIELFYDYYRQYILCNKSSSIELHTNEDIDNNNRNEPNKDKIMNEYSYNIPIHNRFSVLSNI
jgi:hypothetical protein